MDKLRSMLNGEDNTSTDETQGITEQIIGATTFSWSTRIKGFAICFVLGFVLSILGIAVIPLGLKLFALLYTLGNVCSIASTMFLMGPWKQLKSMFHEKRILSTVLVFAFMILTLIAVLKWKKALLALIFCTLQFLAGIWYSISYIPYAQDTVTKGIMSCL